MISFFAFCSVTHRSTVCVRASHAHSVCRQLHSAFSCAVDPSLKITATFQGMYTAPHDPDDARLLFANATADADFVLVSFGVSWVCVRARKQTHGDSLRSHACINPKKKVWPYV